MPNKKVKLYAAGIHWDDSFCSNGWIGMPEIGNIPAPKLISVGIVTKETDDFVYLTTTTNIGVVDRGLVGLAIPRGCIKTMRRIPWKLLGVKPTDVTYLMQ